jgi:hypothetical protein
MNFHQAYIPEKTAESLMSLTGTTTAYSVANRAIFKFCGIVDFFTSQKEFEEFQELASNRQDAVADIDRAEYGDFQTNNRLALQVCAILKSKGITPEIIIEPTFGKGSFILAALQSFENVDRIIGVEIYKSYVWHTKFAIVEFFAHLKTAGKFEKKKPAIILHHQSVFDFDFPALGINKEQVLVLGNPPWVTNAMLSSLNSGNLPVKSNFKQHSGLDAITGKGNFDIGEYISLMLVKAFHQQTGHIAFLVKNAVIKNLVFDQKQNQYKLSGIEKYSIDAQKEFGAAVEASLFVAEFGSGKSVDCFEYDFYQPKDGTNAKFGWVENNFVSDIDAYSECSAIDGKSPLEWRQGVKHDCSKIMEIERRDGIYINGNKEELSLEDDLVYGLLKSSDLKETTVRKSRKFVILTQRRIGQSTRYIKDQFPNTWQYLEANRMSFDKRKSSIYKGKPPFSIFGIGEYSFAPFKIAISGMYKTWHFTLVYPGDGKPHILDDTCYFLGFERETDAVITFALLNSIRVSDFLKSIVFQDSKRMITKEVLMRIDLQEVASFFSFHTICKELENYPELNVTKISPQEWEDYVGLITPAKTTQLTMF